MKIFGLIWKIILITILFTSNSYCDYFFELPEGTSYQYKAEKIEGTDYIRLSDIKIMLFREFDFNIENQELISKNNSIKLIPGTLFILYASNNNNSIYQMLQPAIIHKKELKIPLKSFVKGLDYLGIYKIEITENIISLSKPIEKNNEKLQETPKYIEQMEDDGSVMVINQTSIDESNVNVSTIEKATSSQKYEINNKETDKIENSLQNAGLNLNLNLSYFKSKIKKNTIKQSFYESYSHIDKEFFLNNNIISGIDNSTISMEVKIQTNDKIRKTENQDYLTEESLPPDFYVIPKNLIRKELETQLFIKQ